MSRESLSRQMSWPGAWQCHRPLPFTDAGQRRARGGQRTQQCLETDGLPRGSNKVEDLRLFDVGDCPIASVSAAGSAAWQLAAAISRGRTIARPYRLAQSSTLLVGLGRRASRSVAAVALDGAGPSLSDQSWKSSQVSRMKKKKMMMMVGRQIAGRTAVC